MDVADHGRSAFRATVSEGNHGGQPGCRLPSSRHHVGADCKTVRLAVPPLRIVGFPKPLDVYMDFDAESVDAMIERLTVLRSQMLPPLPALGKRN